MKKTTIILFIFAFFAISSGISRNVYSQNENSIVIPLQVGENPPVQFETLQIEQIYLFYREIPESEHLPNILLMYWSRIGDRDNSRREFHYHYDERWTHWNSLLHTFLHPLGNYALRMKIDDGNISLEIEKFELEFGKAFAFPLEQTAVVENLSISVEYRGHSHGETAPGEHISCSYYTMFLSSGNKQKEIPFEMCSHRPPSFFAEWENYRIDLDVSEGIWQLIVTKINE